MRSAIDAAKKNNIRYHDLVAVLRMKEAGLDISKLNVERFSNAFVLNDEAQAELKRFAEARAEAA